MQSFWLIVLIGALLSLSQLAIGVVIGRILFGRRQNAQAADARDLQRVQSLTGRLYRLMAGVAHDIETHAMQSRVDPVTGLLNRRAFDEALAGRAAAWRLQGPSFCLMMPNVLPDRSAAASLPVGSYPIRTNWPSRLVWAWPLPSPATTPSR